MTRIALVAVLAFAACGAPPPAIDPAVADVAAAARAFVDGLPPALRQKASRPFEDPERTTWAYVPGSYQGVEFGDLDADGTRRAHALLHTLLSARGFEKTMAIVELENLLRVIEGRGGADASHRDPARYTLLVCGDPTPLGTFAVRMQGHHVSLHFTFFAGWLVGATPQFLGSNPHEQREGPHVGQRVLAAEEDLARELLASLDDAQCAAAVISPTAPPDILLGPKAAFSTLGTAKGLAARAMNEAQRALLWRLVEQLAHNLRGEFAEQELARLRPQLDELHFAWAGGRARGQGHYWRVQGTSVAIEYDNTQNDANHVHVVWRDRDRDFGADPLREHLLREHSHSAGK
jgi:hypothetical protein